MSHETPTLAAEQRQRHGSRYSQRLRKAGRLPGVVYGHGADPVSISLDAKATLKHLHHGNHVFNVEIDGKDAETCLVKDLQFGYLGDNVVHVDFTRVDLDEIVTIIVKLDLRGQLAGTKKANTAMVTDLNDVEVSCPVRHIPEAFRVDLESFDESVTVGDIELPEHVTILTSPDSNIAHIEVQAGEDSEDDDAAEGDAPAETTSDS